MRIYYFGVYNTLGGLESFALNLIAWMRNNTDVSFTLLVETSDFSYKSEFESMGVDYCVLPNHTKHPWSFYKALVSLLANQKNSVLQLNVCSYRNGFLFRAAKKAGIPTIVVGHLAALPRKLTAALHYINRFVYRQVGSKIAVGKDVGNFMFGKKTRFSIILNGVDCAKYSYSKIDRTIIRNEFCIDDKTIAIGHFGRLSKQKNQSFSIQLIKQLHKVDPRFELYIFGKPIEPRESKIVNNSICRYIHYLGPVSNPASWLSAMDIVVLPSLGEGLSLSLLEAIQSGLLVLCSDRVEIPSLSIPKLQQVKLDVRLWAEAIFSLFARNSERKGLLALTQYDLTYQCQAYLSAYVNKNPSSA